MTRQEFIETAPLYTRINITNFSPPESITKMCSPCGKETTWRKMQKTKITVAEPGPDIPFDVAGYSCALCRKNSMVVLYQNLDWTEDPKSTFTPKSWHHLAVRKIGQVPPQEVDIPAELDKRLGATAGYYKKALICRGQNYGIAAMAYLRRVVDEKTDELIDVMAELARTYGVEEDQIARLLKVKSEVRYEEKMKIAAELIPEAVKPGGVNPLGQLYHFASVGLHGKTDDECIAIFDDLKADFEYVFRNLHLQAEERREFAKRVQGRAGKKA